MFSTVTIRSALVAVGVLLGVVALSTGLQALFGLTWWMSGVAVLIGVAGGAVIAGLLTSSAR